MKRSLRVIGFLVIAGSLVTAGCKMSISLGETVEGTITSSDSIWYDSYGTPFYYDTYHLPVEPGKGYLVELWSNDGDPIYFECEVSGYDFSSSSYSSEVIYPPPG
ncbi:MAG: hypothetical protein ACLFRY_09385, partial [Spirochaetia bacterium]